MITLINFEMKKVVSNIYYHSIPQSDAYKDLFSSAILIMRAFRKKLPFSASRDIPVDDICACYESSKSLLKVAVNLMMDGVDISVFEFIIELKANAYLSAQFITEPEVFEILLAKKLASYVRFNDPSSVNSLLNYICTSDARNELAPYLFEMMKQDGII